MKSIDILPFYYDISSDVVISLQYTVETIYLRYM